MGEPILMTAPPPSTWYQLYPPPPRNTAERGPFIRHYHEHVLRRHDSYPIEMPAFRARITRLTPDCPAPWDPEAPVDLFHFEDATITFSNVSPHPPNSPAAGSAYPADTGPHGIGVATTAVWDANPRPPTVSSITTTAPSPPAEELVYPAAPTAIEEPGSRVPLANRIQSPPRLDLYGLPLLAAVARESLAAVEQRQANGIQDASGGEDYLSDYTEPDLESDRDELMSSGGEDDDYPPQPPVTFTSPTPRYNLRRRFRDITQTCADANEVSQTGRVTRRVTTFRTDAPSLALQLDERAHLDHLLNIRPDGWHGRERAFARTIASVLNQAADIGNEDEDDAGRATWVPKPQDYWYDYEIRAAAAARRTLRVSKPLTRAVRARTPSSKASALLLGRPSAAAGPAREEERKKEGLRPLLSNSRRRGRLRRGRTRDQVLRVGAYGPADRRCCRSRRKHLRGPRQARGPRLTSLLGGRRIRDACREPVEEGTGGLLSHTPWGRESVRLERECEPGQQFALPGGEKRPQDTSSDVPWAAADDEGTTYAGPEPVVAALRTSGCTMLMKRDCRTPREEDAHAPQAGMVPSRPDGRLGTVRPGWSYVVASKRGERKEGTGTASKAMPCLPVPGAPVSPSRAETSPREVEETSRARPLPQSQRGESERDGRDDEGDDEERGRGSQGLGARADQAGTAAWPGHASCKRLGEA
ncbi:hypothetical protein OH77DRAFT_1440221 [Trametes cingulata]|nr:hypothetical protein OH77DRAFT_1440221 [Trametes cingulata]